VDTIRIIIIDQFLKATQKNHEQKDKLQKELARIKAHNENYRLVNTVESAKKFESLKREATTWNTACNIRKGILFPGRNAPEFNRLQIIKEAQKRIEKIRKWVYNHPQEAEIFCRPYIEEYKRRAEARAAKGITIAPASRMVELGTTMKALV
jgi:hypothetical protein